jgi:hypothetical protein
MEEAKANEKGRIIEDYIKKIWNIFSNHIDREIIIRLLNGRKRMNFYMSKISCGGSRYERYIEHMQYLIRTSYSHSNMGKEEYKFLRWENLIVWQYN